jgi:hypothetical protein
VIECTKELYKCNTYSDQRTDVSVFGTGFTNDNTHGRLCNLSGDHVSGDLDTIANSSHSGCDEITSGGRVCGVCDIDLDSGIASGIRAFNSSCISGAHIVGCVASGPPRWLQPRCQQWPPWLQWHCQQRPQWLRRHCRRLPHLWCL